MRPIKTQAIFYTEQDNTRTPDLWKHKACALQNTRDESARVKERTLTRALTTRDKTWSMNAWTETEVSGSKRHAQQIQRIKRMKERTAQANSELHTHNDKRVESLLAEQKIVFFIVFIFGHYIESCCLRVNYSALDTSAAILIHRIKFKEVQLWQ